MPYFFFHIAFNLLSCSAFHRPYATPKQLHAFRAIVLEPPDIHHTLSPISIIPKLSEQQQNWQG